MSDTESFEYAMKVMRENLAGMYANGHMTKWADIDTSVDLDLLKAAHDREIRDVSQQQYDRGFNDGQHSMDAEHRAVAMRLRALPMNRVEYGSNLYDIIEAVCGTNKAGDVDLRDKLIDLMGGVSNDGCTGCGCAAADCDGDCGLQHEEVNDGGTADDCGADSRGGDGGGDLHLAGVRITDELREWANDGVWSCRWEEFKAIADRIDEQFDRICEQKEAVLQSTIAELVEQCDELQEKLDEHNSTHVELPKDANGEVFRVDGGARVDDLVLTVRQMTLTKSGWKIRAYDENYEVEREPSFFDACAPKPDLIEETIEKLTLGEITQSEAIERIKSIGQE